MVSKISLCLSRAENRTSSVGGSAGSPVPRLWDVSWAQSQRGEMDKELREAEGIIGSPGGGGQEEAECQALARICLQDQLDGSSCRAGPWESCGCCSPPEEDHISPSVTPPTSARWFLVMSALWGGIDCRDRGKQCVALSPRFCWAPQKGLDKDQSRPSGINVLIKIKRFFSCSNPKMDCLPDVHSQAFLFG